MADDLPLGIGLDGDGRPIDALHHLITDDPGLTALLGLVLGLGLDGVLIFGAEASILAVEGCRMTRSRRIVSALLQL